MRGGGGGGGGVISYACLYIVYACVCMHAVINYECAWCGCVC